MPRAELDVANQCAPAASAQRQGQPALGPPQSGSKQQPPPTATPVTTPDGQPMRATPTSTVARPTAPPGTVSPPLPAATATVAVRAPADRGAGGKSVHSKLDPAQGVAAGAMSAAHAAHPHTTADAHPNQSRMPAESSVKQNQTLLQHTTGTAVRKSASDARRAKDPTPARKARRALHKQAVAGTPPRQSFARPIFKTKN
jgi:hypothetical protein